MSDPLIGFVSLVAILLVIQTGLPIAIALISASFIGMWAITGNINIAGNLMVLSASESISKYTFGVIPLFMLMGMIISVSDIGRDIFDVSRQVFRRVRGGVGMSAVAANAVFAAVNGTSIASASVFTRIAVPEMRRLGYTARFSVGVVAGSSVLGMLIPPSLLLILFGIVAEVSIGDLFTAGIVPGLVLAGCYILLIIGLVRFWPAFVGPGGTELPSDADSELMALPMLISKSAPIVLLVVLILGGIYGGLFTPTEAGAAGALGALVIVVAQRRLSWRKFWEVLTEAGHVTATISILLIGAHMYSSMLASSGLPGAMQDLALGTGMEVYALIIVYLIAVLILGTILDAGAIILILVPLILPTLLAGDINLVWFGVLTIIAVEIGLLTPPLGIAIFVVKANLDDPSVTLGDIFAGTVPFALTMLAVLCLVYVWPQIALLLVS